MEMVAAQAPSRQACVPVQAAPQAPQFCASCCVSVQTLLHWAMGQGAQRESLHTSVPAQATPQPPQFRGSLTKVAQASASPASAPPHVVWPAAHTTWHAPETQAALPPAGTAQAFPQLPQLARSVAGVTQTVPQASWPVAQPTGSEPVVEQAATQTKAAAVAKRRDCFMVWVLPSGAAL